MKIQQTAFMLIAVILFFALVGMLLLVFKISDLKESAGLLEEKNALLLVTKLANSPEFSCGQAFGTEKTNCIDMDKMMMLKENIAKYMDFWGVSDIEIRKIYPEMNRDVNCRLERYPKCNVIELFSEFDRDGESEGTGISNFVSLCRKESHKGKIYDLCELGKIIVSYKTK